MGSPPKDASQDYKLIKASEDGGKTYVNFYRNATTGDDKDVQFTVKCKFLNKRKPLRTEGVSRVNLLSLKSAASGKLLITTVPDDIL